MEFQSINFLENRVGNRFYIENNVLWDKDWPVESLMVDSEFERSTNQWIISDLGDAKTYSALNFAFLTSDGNEVIRGIRIVNRRIFIFATLADNEHIDPNYAQSLEGLPEAEKKAKKYGDFDAYLGQVFDEYRDRHYPDEPDNALHLIEPFDIPEWWPKIVSIDWGFAPPAMSYACFGAISPDGRLYVYREKSWQKTKIEEWGAELKEYIDRDNPRVVKLCQSAKQDRGQDHTIEQQVNAAIGRIVVLSGNTPGSRIATKQLLHEYFRWKPKYIPHQNIRAYNDEYAAWVLRNRGLQEYQSYLASFNPPQEETNLPKVLIFNTCQLLNGAIKSCVYDKTNPEDVAEFPGHSVLIICLL